MNIVALKDLITEDCRPRVDSEFIVLATESSDLGYLLGDTTMIPTRFEIRAPDGSALVYLVECERDADNDVVLWMYRSTQMIQTASGPRRVSVVVYND